MTGSAAAGAREGQGPAYLVRLGPGEREVLLQVVDGVVALLGGPAADPDPQAHPLDLLRLGGPPLDPPDDPALRRLLPDVSHDDAELAAEFRRLTEVELRATKVDHLLRLRAALAAADPHLAVGPADARACAAAMTDLRLVLAERLDLRTDDDSAALYRLLGRRAARGADAAVRRRRFLAEVYVVLSGLQDALVDLMTQALGDLPPSDRR